MGAPAESAPPVITGYLPAQLIAHSYLGSLWVALDQRQGTPGRPVLLRCLQLQEGIPTEAVQRMACAARDAMALSHENILHVLAVLQQDESLAVAYEYVEAEPLRSLQAWAAQRNQRFPVSVTLRIMIDLARGIKALHGTLAGWPSAPPYGGISPDSVLVARDGRTRLCDALTSSCATLLEGLSLNVAKLAYTAPEQAYATAPLAPASDVFSCGVLLWELLAGTRLLTGSRPTVERKLLEHDWPRLATQLAGQTLSPALLQLVERCLASDAGKRPPNPAALANELEQCGGPVAQLPEVARFVSDIAAQRFDQRKHAVRASLLLPAALAPSAAANGGRPAQAAAPVQASPPAQTPATAASPAATAPAASSPEEPAAPEASTATDPAEAPATRAEPAAQAEPAQAQPEARAAAAAAPAPAQPAAPASTTAQRALPAAPRASAAQLRIPLPGQLNRSAPQPPAAAASSARKPVTRAGGTSMGMGGTSAGARGGTSVGMGAGARTGTGTDTRTGTGTDPGTGTGKSNDDHAKSKSAKARAAAANRERAPDSTARSAVSGRYSLPGSGEGQSLGRVSLLRASVPRPRNSQSSLRAVSLSPRAPAPAQQSAPVEQSAPAQQSTPAEQNAPAEQSAAAATPPPAPAAEPTFPPATAEQLAALPTPTLLPAPSGELAPEPSAAPAQPAIVGGSVPSGPSATPGTLTARERFSSAPAASSITPHTESAAPPVPIFGLRRARSPIAQTLAFPSRSSQPPPSDAPATERSSSLHDATSVPPLGASVPPESGWESVPPGAAVGALAAPAVAADDDAPLSQEAVVIPEARAVPAGMTTLMGIPLPPPVQLPRLPLPSEPPPRQPVQTPHSSPAVVVIPPESYESEPPPSLSSAPPLPMGSLVATLAPPPFSDPPSAPSSDPVSGAGQRREGGWSHPPPPRSTLRPRRRWLARAGASVALGAALITVLWVRDAGRSVNLAASAAAPHAAALAPPSSADDTAAPRLAPQAAPAREALAAPKPNAELSDAQLLELFALEPRATIADCNERRTSARLTASRARQKAQGQLKAALREQARGNIAAAHALLCSATQLHPGNAPAWQALAELALQRGDAAQAERALQQALKRKSDPLALAALGDAEALLGNLPRARSLWLRSAPKSEPQRLAEQYQATAHRALAARDFATALTHYRRAAVLTAGASAPSAGMARALRALDQANAAEPWDERAAALRP